MAMYSVSHRNFAKCSQGVVIGVVYKRGLFDKENTRPPNKSVCLAITTKKR